MKVLDGLTDLRLKILGEVDHGLLTIARLPEVLRTMLEITVGSALALRVAALTSHLDEGAVNEAVSMVEKKMETAAKMAFASGERGGVGHENTTET